MIPLKKLPPIDCNKKRKRDIKWLIFKDSFRSLFIWRSLVFNFLFPFCRFRDWTFSPSLPLPSFVVKANDTENNKPRKKRNKERKRREKIKITSDGEQHAWWRSMCEKMSCLEKEWEICHDGNDTSFHRSATDQMFLSKEVTVYVCCVFTSVSS